VAGDELSDDDLVAQWQRLTAGVAHVQRRVERLLEDAGLPAQWCAPLLLLLRADQHRIPMSVLAREVSMTSGGFTKLADRMAREGLIDRRGSADDRRVVHAVLTPAGRRLAQRAAARYESALRESVLTVVSVRDLAAAARALGALNRTESEADAPAGMVATQRDPALPDRRGRGRAGS
jgi:DNA-binding MarR family transcriptional regulator